MPLLLLIATGVAGLGFVIWRRRNKGEFATRDSDQQRHEVDLRERDESQLR